MHYVFFSLNKVFVKFLFCPKPLLSPKDAIVNNIIMVYAEIGLRIYRLKLIVMAKSHNRYKVSYCNKCY